MAKETKRKCPQCKKMTDGPIPIHPYDVMDMLETCSAAEIEAFKQEPNPNDPGIVNIKGRLYRQTTLAPVVTEKGKRLRDARIMQIVEDERGKVW